MISRISAIFARYSAGPRFAAAHIGGRLVDQPRYFPNNQIVEFRWNEWNLDHAARHGVTRAEAEALVRRGRARHVGDNKYRVEGRGTGGRFIQVVYVIDPDATVYVIHARPMVAKEKRRQRRREKP